MPTTARCLRPHSTEAKQGIQELIASLNSRPAAATIIRRMPSQPATNGTTPAVAAAQALARHALPGGDISSILDRALTLLIDDLERRRFARVASPRPRSGESAASGRHIPAAVRRAVWQRDQERCAFVGRAGRCRETAFLEFHHVAPYAAGGAATTENIELRCRAHNQHEARLFFADSLVRERH